MAEESPKRETVWIKLDGVPNTQCYFQVHRYNNNNRLAICLKAVEDDENWGVITLNAPENRDFADNVVLIKDYEENVPLIADIKDQCQHLFKDTGRTAEVGHCVVPIWIVLPPLLALEETSD